MLQKPRLLAALLPIAIIIGFRYRIGADWGSYLNYLDIARYLSFLEASSLGDPGYILLNWAVARTFNAIWAVNLVCGLIFSFGLVAFARIQPRPWLALLVAVPYLVIVVAMGYSRQGVAIGFAMLGLVALQRDRSSAKFVIWIALAATFHKTAVLLVPLGALSAVHGRIWTTTWIGVATLLLYYLFLESSVESLIAGYIEAEYDSQGAAVRAAMNALPAAIFLLGRWRFHLARGERRLWTNMALLALTFAGLLFVSPSSTAIDRMGLYLIPVQIFVLSRLPDAFPAKGGEISPVTLGVIGYSAIVQFIWLNFATHARYWLPYQFYPLL